MTKFGDFTSEAYDALREAYANESKQPLEEEIKGYDLDGQNYPVETEDARATYLDKVPLWQYPTGHSDYEKPDPDSLITSLRGEETTEEELEDIDALIDEILEGDDDNDDAPIDEILGDETDDVT